MKQTFYELIAYLEQNEESFHFDEQFDMESLKSEILAFSSMFEEKLQ